MTSVPRALRPFSFSLPDLRGFADLLTENRYGGHSGQRGALDPRGNLTDAGPRAHRTVSPLREFDRLTAFYKTQP
ncbi:hypothetical protein STEG23_022691, partial [Scotinomys teguina]